MTDGCVHSLKNSSWKCHQIAAGQLLLGQPVRKRQAVRPVHHVQNHTGRVLSSSQPGGPPCWASHLAFGIIGHAASPLNVSAMSCKNLSPSFRGSFLQFPCFSELGDSNGRLPCCLRVLLFCVKDIFTPRLFVEEAV